MCGIRASLAIFTLLRRACAPRAPQYRALGSSQVKLARGAFDGVARRGAGRTGGSRPPAAASACST